MKNLKKKSIEEQVTHAHNESVKYTEILSTICRQISFADGALFWFVKTELKISIFLILVGYIFLILYFLLDLFQYLIGYITYKNKALDWEKDLINGIGNEKNYEYSEHFTYWIEKFLYWKLGFLFLASLILIICFVLGIFGHHSKA